MQYGLINNLMGIFRKKARTELEKFSLIKIFIVLEQHNWKIFIGKLVDTYEVLLDEEAGRYWVNYSKASSFNKERLLKNIFSRERSDFENLVLTNEDSSISVDMNQISAVKSGMYEVRLTLPGDVDLKRLFTDLSADLVKLGRVLYGYARKLTLDHSPVTENKIKTTFGSISVIAEPFNKTWFRAPSMTADMLKGVYQLNLVRRTLLREDYFGPNIDSAVDLNKDLVIVECSPSDLKLILNAHRDISRFVNE